MSLIEEARRRQRRRRGALGAVVLAALVAAVLVAVVHRTGSRVERQAQVKPATLVVTPTTAEGGSVVILHSTSPATPLRTLVTRLGRHGHVTYTVRVNPKTGRLETLTTTTTR